MPIDTKKGTSRAMKSDQMSLNLSPEPSPYRRTKSGSDIYHSPLSLSISPRRSLGSVEDRRKSRSSYLNKKKSRVGSTDRKVLIRNSLLGSVDSVFGEEAGESADVSFQNENSYLKRLLLSPDSTSSLEGPKKKKLNVDNCRLKKKKKRVKKLPLAPLAGSSGSSGSSKVSKPKVTLTTKTTDKTIKNLVASTKKKIDKMEQSEKRLSTDSVETAPMTDISDSTDNDTLTVVTNSTASLSIHTPSVDYTDMFHSFESISVEVNFEEPSVERKRKISFASQAEQAHIADLVFWSADKSEEFQWEDLFYTEDELADQRHEAFLEMCGVLDDNDF